MALRTRLGSGGVTLLTLGDGVFPLQPLIFPGGFDILPRKLVVIFKIIFVGHNRSLVVSAMLAISPAVCGQIADHKK